MNIAHNTGVSTHIAKYSDAIEVQAPARLLVTAGTPGLGADGTLPEDFATEAENAWQNVLNVVEAAGFSLNDLVKVTTTLTNPDDIPAYREIRERILGDARPAFMLQVVPQMIRPDFRVEIEIIAAASE